MPRAWLVDGKRLAVTGAPTYFGPVNFQIDSAAETGRLSAKVEFTGAGRPSAVVLHLRHPNRKRLRSVTVNYAAWKDFDVPKESIRIPNPTENQYRVIADY